MSHTKQWPQVHYKMTAHDTLSCVDYGPCHLVHNQCERKDLMWIFIVHTHSRLDRNMYMIMYFNEKYSNTSDLSFEIFCTRILTFLLDQFL